MLAAVKADAYGHGLVPVSKALVEIGVDWLGVAIVEEGLQLRESGVDLPVLVLGGLFIGGVDSVDSKDDYLWFYAQVGVGPVVMAIDAVNQGVVKDMPEDEQRAWRSLGHVNSVGTLFIGLAGLMNIVVILEAFYPRPGQRRERRAEAT